MCTQLSALNCLDLDLGHYFWESQKTYQYECQSEVSSTPTKAKTRKDSKHINPA